MTKADSILKQICGLQMDAPLKGEVQGEPEQLAVPEAWDETDFREVK